MKNKKYFTMNYLYKGRWISYWYQLKEITNLKGVKSILDIGPGNKIVSNILLQMGYNIKTLDIDSQTEPDIVADIKNIQEFVKDKFDLIICCQVLEHLPYSDFTLILKNLYQLTKKYLILTLPYTSKGTFKLYYECKILPFIKPVSWIEIFNFFPKKHIFNGQHYWEIGKKGYQLKRILTDINENGFKIITNYPIFENPYHYLIIAEKSRFS